MQTSELCHLRDWINDNVLNKSIIADYLELDDTLQHNITVTSDNRKLFPLKSFTPLVEDLQDKLESIDKQC